MVFDFEHGRAQNRWRFRAVGDFIIARFAYSKNGVAAKKVIAESDGSGLIKKVFEPIVRAVGNVAFGGQREGSVFARAVGVAWRSLRERRWMNKERAKKTG